jgi:Ca-activated chloride channel family protein
VVFRSGVDLVALSVTVERAKGSYVADLRPSDFRVFEEGVQQEISFFGAGQVPVDLVLMLDTSASMSGRLPIAQRAASNFVDALAPQDRAVLMTFGTRAVIAAPVTTDRQRLRQAISAVRAGGTTALFDAVYVALQEVGRTDGSADLHRRAVVVLSDGDDTTSLVAFDSVLDQARRSGVAIYVIALQSPGEGRRVGSGAYEMRRLAQETGGRAYFTSALEGLEDVYRTIAQELAHQYAIAYVARQAPQPDRFRRVAVVVDRPGVRVRTKSGYITSGRATASGPTRHPDTADTP